MNGPASGGLATAVQAPAGQATGVQAAATQAGGPRVTGPQATAAPSAPARRADHPAEAPQRRGSKSKQRLGRLAARQKASRRRVFKVYAISAGVAILAGGALVLELLPSGGPVHDIVTPKAIGTYAQAPALAKSMKADALRSGIVAQSGGEATNVVAVVYQSGSGPGAAGGAAAGGASVAPDTGTSLIVLFIGGNLSGSSASSFISSFMNDVPGASGTSAGPMGGEAACIPSTDGNPAECAWADNDTFGLVASPNLSTAALASEMRQMRVSIEHRVR